MKDLFLRYLITSVFLVLLLPEQGNSIKILKSLLKSIKKQIKKKVKTKNNEFDDSVVYAIPTPDGQGFILHGYGKPYDPHAYDKDVDIYQIPKMWNGQFTIPNFFHSEDSGYDYYKEPERKVKGSDNRLGFRVAIPFLGDFQYLREIGPGRFTDNLGPGTFNYPGYKDKKKKKHHDGYHQGYDAHYSHHGPSVDEYGVGHGSSYDHGHHTGHTEGYHGNAVDEVYSYSASNEVPAYHEKTEVVESKENEPDPLEGLRNYPWYTRRR